MEVLARVDLGIDEMKEVVSACHGCLVWGGHVNLSPADDILISVERALSLDTREQMVASIMSKKLAAGSTHLVIDLPVGPAAKVRTATEAMRLRKLFEFVGDHFGIAVEVITTDGRQPIGWGIGPVLEAQDVMAVLANDPNAPSDLREKSLRLAAHVLENDPDLRGGTGYARARELLESGAALKQMQKIIDAQGPSSCQDRSGHAENGYCSRPTTATVTGIDCLRLNRLARMAGAPIDKGAGIRILKKIGDRVEKGEPIYRIHAFEPSEYELAVGAAKAETGYQIDGKPSVIDGRPAVTSVAVHYLPASAADANRLAACLAVPCHEIAIHIFPDGELRVSAWPAAAVSICICGARPAERQAPRVVVRGGIASAKRQLAACSCRALSLLHAPGHRLSSWRGDKPEGHRAAHLKSL